MRIGIDLGGTKIEGLLLDSGSNGDKEVARLRLPTPRGDYPTILNTIHDVIKNLEQQAGTRCTVGIGTPGSLNVQGLLRNSNTTELNGKPLLKDLENLCERPIRISNDANCFALSEALAGAAKQYSTVFGVILGTGVGGALIVDKKLLLGANHIGGEWGHNPLPRLLDKERAKKRQCYCGKQDCMETFLSGPGLSQTYFFETQQQLSADEIASKATQGDCIARKVMKRYEDQLARGLASVINIFDPDCIVLGGGVSNIQSLYKNIPAIWNKYIFSDSVQTILLAPKGGDSAGVKGAAWLWS